MRIENLDCSMSGDRMRASALVKWEECERPERLVYFETDPRFANDLSPNPNAFLLATVMYALCHGEKRILVEGRLCPELRNGVITAMQQIRHWYGPSKYRLLTIEATEGFAPRFPRLERRTASLMSGGVDALSLLRRNRLDYPLDHPNSIRDCFFIYGFDIGCHVTLPGNERKL